MTLTFEYDLDIVNHVEPACQISRSKVIYFRVLVGTHRQTQTHPADRSTRTTKVVDDDIQSDDDADKRNV